jgi:uncharacterized protein (DUF1684 family)
MNRRNLTYYILIITVGLMLILLISSLNNDQVTTVNSTYEAEILKKRKEKDDFFSKNPGSPLPVSMRTQFTALEYYPPDTHYIIRADWQPIPENVTETVNNHLKAAGKLSFFWQNKPYQLKAYWSNEEGTKNLFIPFKDATANQTTYGGGRYLSAAWHQDMQYTILDFNLAYNPYCAYNPDFVCPVPPPENQLPFAIEAGEKILPLTENHK